MATRLLAIDQGTSSTRALVFDSDLQVLGIAQQEVPLLYPQPGWVEQDPEVLWTTTLASVKAVLEKTGSRAFDIAAIGIANQRETTILWDRKTGKAIHNAIVWQDRRTASACASLRARGCEDEVAAKTGLLLDPYFSATKIAWILDAVPGARERAMRGEIAFGTVDSFLLFRLTGGRVHATDATNASRTMLCGLVSGTFDADLLALFEIPAAVLPEIRDSAGDFGTSESALFGGGIRIAGVAGDQQAATIGQGCFLPGMMKATYGTGAFMLLNIGDEPVPSHNRLLTTIAYQLGGKRTYALEGAVFVAGAAVKWLRDGLKIIESAGETAVLAASSDPSQPVYFVPALSGLGAPYWDPHARGAISGLSGGSGRAEIVRATLESAGYQTQDLLAAMRADWQDANAAQTVLKVDGGMAANDWFLQFLADIVAAPVERPTVLETTALGAAYLAGLGSGVAPEPEVFARERKPERPFEPSMEEEMRARKLAGWHDAVRRVLS
ncbi:MAG TPA: glycerol kinase GlpK [Micropepsaceae bacterium]|nr:glycerol kinase GlpK [Micropepsaceae bacterium]